MLTSILSISLGAILINNFIFSQFLGCCPVPRLLEQGRHRRRHGPRSHLCHGPCIRDLLGRRSVCARASWTCVPADLDLHSGHRRAGSVRRDVPEEVHPLAVLGTGHLPAPDHHQLRGARRCSSETLRTEPNFIESTVYGITGGLGFLLAIVLFASVRERVESAEYPKSFEGFPICLVTASLLALAFMGFRRHEDLLRGGR